MPETDENKITDRDSFGRIKPGGKVLSSEAARELAQRGKKKRAGERDERLDKLIAQAGYEGKEDCPELLLSTLEEVAKGGSRVYSGVNAVLRLTGAHKDPAIERVRLQPGEVCSRCGRNGILELFNQVDQETSNTVLTIIENILRDHTVSDGIKQAPMAPTNGDLAQA